MEPSMLRQVQSCAVSVNFSMAVILEMQSALLDTSYLLNVSLIKRKLSCLLYAHKMVCRYVLPQPFKLVEWRWFFCCYIFLSSPPLNQYLLNTNSSILTDFLMRCCTRVFDILMALTRKMCEPIFMKHVFLLTELLHWVLLFRKHNAKSPLSDVEQRTDTTFST